jgi:hypothetical protein
MMNYWPYKAVSTVGSRLLPQLFSAVLAWAIIRAHSGDHFLCFSVSILFKSLLEEDKWSWNTNTSVYIHTHIHTCIHTFIRTIIHVCLHASILIILCHIGRYHATLAGRVRIGGNGCKSWCVYVYVMQSNIISFHYWVHRAREKRLCCDGALITVTQ